MENIRVHYKSVYGHWRVYELNPFKSIDYKFKTEKDAVDFTFGLYTNITSFKICRFVDKLRGIKQNA